MEVDFSQRIVMYIRPQRNFYLKMLAYLDMVEIKVNMLGFNYQNSNSNEFTRYLTFFTKYFEINGFSKYLSK